MDIHIPQIMLTQPKTAILKQTLERGWGWGLYTAVFLQGTKCKIANNQPEINGLKPYWVTGSPQSICSDGQKATMEEFKSWEHNYGFLVDANDVEDKPKKTRKKI